MDGFAVLFVLIVGGAIYFVPTIVAFARDHEYRWVILAFNAVGGWTFVFWAVALVWAVFPRDKLFVDPLVGSATGASARNVGDLAGEAAFGRERGYRAAQGRSAVPGVSPFKPKPQSADQAHLLDILERLHRLRESGAITAEEFEIQKRQAMDRYGSPT